MATSQNKIAEEPAQKIEDKQATSGVEHPVDAKLQKLTADVLPKSPYILTGRVSYNDEHVRNYYPQNTVNWRRYSPFKPGEEELQHVTYHDRSNEHDIRSMYARKGWDDGNGSIVGRGEPYNRTSNDGTPHQGQAPKKKITLAEYKNKDRSKAATSAPPPKVPKLNQDIKVDTKVTTDITTPKTASQSQQVEQRGHKRSADSMSEIKDSKSLQHSPSLPPLKKARASAEPSPATKLVQKEKAPKDPTPEAAPDNLEVRDHNDTSHEMKRSEGISTQSTDKNKSISNKSLPDKPNKPCLPPMLSPLSSEVEDEIAKWNSSKAGEARVEKPAVVASLKKSTTSTKGTQEQKDVKSATGQIVKDGDSKNVATPKTTPHGQNTGNKSVSTPTPKTTPEASKRMRLRVVLKIKKKANRKNLHTYLSLKPTPGRNSLFPNRAIEHEHRPEASKSLDTKSDNGVDSSKTKTTTDNSKPQRAGGSKVGDKRGRPDAGDDEPERPTKRKQISGPSHSEKLGTPRSARTTSPAVGNTAMIRATSSQGSVHTPQQSMATGTPTAPPTGRSRRQYTSPDKPKSPDLRSEAQIFLDTARQLKHSADVFLKRQQTITEEERKQGLVLGTESVLCFVFAFVLRDTGLHYSDRNAWNSIIPLLSNLQNVTAKVSSLEHMSGLLHQLEGIIRDQIAYSDLQVLSNADPPSQEKCQELHNHTMKAQNAWRTGWVKLDVTDLPSRYPETWAKRDQHRFAYGKGRDAVMKGEYKRKYNLPMNNMTSGLEAVNFGMNFLKEWSKLNGVEWKPSLTL